MLLSLALGGLGVVDTWADVPAPRALAGAPGARADSPPEGRKDAKDAKDAKAAKNAAPSLGESFEPLKLSPEVRRAIRELVSSDAAERLRGEQTLRRLGVRVAPQIEQWLNHVRLETDMVERVLADIIRGESTESSSPLLDLELRAAAYFDRKRREVRELLDGGDYRRARELAEAMLVLEGDGALSFELRRLVREARERLTARELEPRIDVAELIYEVGEKPEFVFRLHNRSQRPARVEVDRGVLGELDIEVTSQYQDSSSRESEARINLRRDAASDVISLGPGEVWTYKVPFQLEEELPLAGMAARVRFQATFRPRRWEIEGLKDSNIPLRAEASEFWLVPPGQKRAVADPLSRLKKAVVFRKPEAFLVAGWLCVWGGERDADLNEKLVDLLVNDYEALDPPLEKLAQKFLEKATGRNLARAEEWRAWWAEYRPKTPPDGHAPPGTAATLLPENRPER
jgi:hypothetical protein